MASLAAVIPAALDEVIGSEQDAVAGSGLPNRLLDGVRHLCGTALAQLGRQP